MCRHKLTHVCACVDSVRWSWKLFCAALPVLVCVAMQVTIDKTYLVTVDDSPPWKVGIDLVQVINDDEFVKFRSYDQSLIKLIVHTTGLDLAKSKKFSLARLPGYRKLVEIRNAAAFPLGQGDDGDDANECLFGSAALPKAKRQRVSAIKLREMRATPDTFEFDVPGGGNAPDIVVCAVKPLHPCDELCFRFTPDTLAAVVRFIRMHGGFEPETVAQRRQYGSDYGEPGVWRNGSAGFIRKVQAGSDDEDDTAKKWKVVEGVKRKKETADSSPDAIGRPVGAIQDSPSSSV